MTTRTNEALRADIAACVPHLSIPDPMRSATYIEDVIVMDGPAAWALWQAAARNDLVAAEAALDSRPELVHAQHWYCYPVTMAAWAGNAAMVQLLLERGSDPGRSRGLYYSWDRMLTAASTRGFHDVGDVLEDAMRERFSYHPDFERLIARPIRDGAPADLDAALSQRPDLALKADPLGRTGVVIASEEQDPATADRFLDLGVDINAQRADGATAPQIADDALARRLIDRGADYCLTLACGLGDMDRVREILADDPRAAGRLDSRRQSPLKAAAARGHVEIVRALLGAGADPSQPEDLEPSGGALFQACGSNHHGMVKLLLEAGADPRAYSDSSGNCYTICEHHPGDTSGRRALLREYGADAPDWSLEGDDAVAHVLENRALFDDSGWFRMFVGHADVNALEAMLATHPMFGERVQPHSTGGTPRCPSTVDAFRLLVDHGLDLFRRDWLGKTYLHHAAIMGATDLIEFLLDAGLDPNAIELHALATPMARAAELGEYEAVKTLLARGADPNAPESCPDARPLACAMAANQTGIAELLRTRGATA